MTIATDPQRVPPLTLGTRLRLAREWREKDQDDIATELGKSRQTISNYERGYTTPDKLALNAWAVICDVDVEWLKHGTVLTSPTGGGNSQDQIRSGVLRSQGNVTRITRVLANAA